MLFRSGEDILFPLLALKKWLSCCELTYVKGHVINNQRAPLASSQQETEAFTQLPVRNLKLPATICATKWLLPQFCLSWDWSPGQHTLIVCLTPTRLPCPWDSPGKNTGVGCLLQCMKVKSESEVTQSYPTLRDPIDRSPPGSSIHGIFQERVLEWVAIYSSRESS